MAMALPSMATRMPASGHLPGYPQTYSRLGMPDGQYGAHVTSHIGAAEFTSNGDEQSKGYFDGISPLWPVANLLRPVMSSNQNQKLFDQASPWPQAYDEDVQEDIYLRQDSQSGRDSHEVGYPPVKNTFLHYDVRKELVSGRENDQAKWSSAPDVVMQKSFHTRESPRHFAQAATLQQRIVEEQHAQGVCKPCAYYLYKADGCRQGDQCEFCHLCQRGEIKKRKKEKKRALRAAAAAQDEATELSEYGM